MHIFLQFNLLILLLFSSSSCKRQNKITLQIDVKDEFGYIVNDAYVELNGRKIGDTDLNGELKVNFNLKRGEHRIKIMKETEESAYEPFEKSIFFFQKNEKIIFVHAVLRANPKPFAEDNSYDDFPELTKKEEETKIASLDSKEETVPAAIVNEATPVEKEELPEPIFSKFDPKIDQALNSGDYRQAITLLKKIQIKDPTYIEAGQKIAEIYLNELKEYKSALSSYDKLTRLPQLGKYENPKYYEIYMGKALAYFQLGEIFATKNKKESTRFFKNTYWITNQVLKISNDVEKSEEITENLSYYKALSFHRIWQNNPKLTPSWKVSKEWENYQRIAKNIKKKNHPNYFVNSEKYLKQVKM